MTAPATHTLDESRTVRQVAARKRGPARKHARLSQRAKVVTAFRDLANGEDARTADERTKDWYRSSCMEWARSLS
jgi:hypothetical protein